MLLSIQVEMDNAAFEDNRGSESARILRNLSDKIEGGDLEDGDQFTLLDMNGNRVGKAIVTEREERQG